MKTRLKFLKYTASTALVVMFAFIAGCGETTDPNPIYIDNPNVSFKDSIEVYEDSAAGVTRTGLNLKDLVNTIDTDGLRDCSLQDLNNSGKDFFLQNGELLNSLLPPGFEIRFFQVYTDTNAITFDTLSKVQGYTSFVPNDFTQNGTEFGGYFNAPLSSKPVYCFWLKGRKDAVPSSKNIYGIIQPREATDRDPFNVYGYRMSFRVRINTNGENDFRKQILSAN